MAYVMFSLRNALLVSYFRFFQIAAAATCTVFATRLRLDGVELWAA